MSFLGELKRRNVIRMAGLYLVAAWLIVQVAETLLPIYDTPGWVLKALVMLLAVGFLPALVFSWVFELTPQGLRRDSEVDRSQSAVDLTARKLDLAVIALLLAVAALFWFRPAAMPAPAPAPTAAAAATAAESPPAPADTPAVSIAVLPFADLSAQADQAYFADGIAEEILNVLASVDGLVVASRTSSFQFRSQQSLGVPAIADALKVRHVLEGSVRKAGDRIRISAQLIDASRDAQLWSETFDRVLSTDNLFDIQDEIAAAIVAAIDQNLGVDFGALSQVRKRTGNVDAYALFLQARTLYYARVELSRVADLLAQAVELDPGFSDALAMRAAVFAFAAEYGWALAETPAQARAKARELAGAALAIEPDQGLALGVISLSQMLDAASGEATVELASILDGYNRALTIEPRNVDLINWRGYSLIRAGYFEQSEADFRRCRELEPTYAPCRANLAGALLLLKRADEARAEINAAAAKGVIGPDIPILFTLHALRMREAFYLVGANLSGLRGWHDFDELYEALDHPEVDHTLLRARLSTLSEGDASNAQQAALLIALGQHDEATNAWTAWLPVYASYRKSATFKDYVIRSGLLRYWQQHGFPAQCKPLGSKDFDCD
ncbi:MAG: hypothetical protein AB7E72_18200 [Lysobacterales bacterium]